MLVATSRYGVGLSAESAAHIAAARNLAAGHGYRSFDDTPYTAWAPLLATVLAIPGLIGVDPVTGARFLNALTMAGIVYASGLLLSRHLRSKSLCLIAAGAVALSPALHRVSTMACPGPLYALLVLSFVLATGRFLRQPQPSSCNLVAGLAALCVLQSGAGFAVVALGVLACTLAETTWSRRWMYLAVFIAISCVPVAAWVLHGYWQTGSVNGWPPTASFDSFVRNRDAAVDIATAWFLPASVPLFVRRALVGAVFCGAIGAMWFGRHRLARGTGNSLRPLWPCVVWLLPHAAFLLVARPAASSLGPLRESALAPAFVFVLLLCFVTIDRLATLGASVATRRGAIAALTAGACGLWLVYPLIRVSHNVRVWTRDGAGGYSHEAWRQSPSVIWLRDRRPANPVYSNGAEALYLLAGIGARPIPPRAQTLAAMASDVTESAQLVWFDRLQRDELRDLEDLTTTLCLERLERFSDATVYAILPGKERVFCDAPVDGVWSRTFTSQVHESSGSIDSWTVREDATMASLWRLRTPDGTLIEWEVAGAHERSDGFQFVGSGRAREHRRGSTSPCVLHLAGTVEGPMAKGTYRIEFEARDWPAGDRGTWQICLARPVHRFWADAAAQHFYTIRRGELKTLRRSPDTWTYEGVAFHAFEPARHPSSARAVHRLRSRVLNKQWLTIDEREKGALLKNGAAVWEYVDVAFYAFPERGRPPETVGVHRFWSPSLRAHFYTTSEDERDRLLKELPSIWQYEGIAWYAPTGGRPRDEP